MQFQLILVASELKGYQALYQVLLDSFLHGSISSRILFLVANSNLMELKSPQIDRPEANRQVD